MKKHKILIRLAVTIVFLAISLLWHKELTERRARQAADDFMGQLLTRVGWNYESFIPVPWNDIWGGRHPPGWLISYSTYFAMGEPISIYVDIFGRVRTANSKTLVDLIAISTEERWKKQSELVKEDIAFWEKADRERQQRKAEQSVAPLPRAP